MSHQKNSNRANNAFTFYDAPERAFNYSGKIKHPSNTYAVHYRYYPWGKNNFCRDEYHWVHFSQFPNVEEFIAQHEESLSENVLINYKITFYETRFY